MLDYKWLIDIYSNSMTYSLCHSSDYHTDKIKISPHFSHIDSEHFYYFSSYLLDHIENEQDVLDKAKDLLCLYNGILYLLNYTHEPILFSSEPKCNLSYKYNKECFIKDYSQSFEYVSLVQKIWNYLEKDEYINKIIRLFGKRHKDTEFDDLYKIYEILYKKWKSIDENKANKIYKAYGDFRRTANHPVSLGDDARHGYNDSEPLSKPMGIIEARKKVKFDCQKLIEQLLDITINKESLPEYIFDESSWSEIRELEIKFDEL